MTQSDLEFMDDTRTDYVRDRVVVFVGKLASMSHRDAKRILSECGGISADAISESTHIVVIGGDHLRNDDDLDMLNQDCHARVDSGELEVVAEAQFWQKLGIVGDESHVQSHYTPAMLAQLIGIPVSTVRRWQRRGLITPTRQVHRLPYFDFQEVSAARRLAQLISEGKNPKTIENKLSKLALFCEEVGRSLSQLSVIVEGRHVLLREKGGLVEPNGQTRFDFDAFEEDIRTGPRDLASESAISISLDTADLALDQLKTPDQFLSLAIELEDHGQNQKAIEVYRAMLMAFGPRPEVCFQLAELLYFDHQYEAARERYWMAIELDETFVEARANLGCVFIEFGQLEMAISAFEGALEHHPDYPDVHFHLARTLDQSGRPDEAVIHWERFLELSPNSPWADEARHRLNFKPATE